MSKSTTTPTDVMYGTDELQQLLTQQGELLDALREARSQEVAARTELEILNAEFGQLEDDMARLHRSKAVQFFSSKDWEDLSADPRDAEGRPTPEWGELALERVLRHDRDWNETIQNFYEKQNRLARLKAEALAAQSNAMTAQEALMSLNVQIRARTALIQAGADG